VAWVLHKGPCQLREKGSLSCHVQLEVVEGVNIVSNWPLSGLNMKRSRTFQATLSDDEALVKKKFWHLSRLTVLQSGSWMP